MSSRAASVISLSTVAAVVGLIAENGEKFISSLSVAWDLGVRVVQG